ncbi:FxsA family protein [Paraliomyxa miuraensis]|uniref:FxsA family protein n=1 Tax=Paraliomyxa miuraensis TaxID=376150 RepID=UPI002251BD71|nr:FxsA family protein [Paraliomyxa miuraensis]MCX4242694.1 FxsA family protein [Paraliomyxa miuraensis]
MLGKLLLLFTVVPVVELYLLITIGAQLGAGATVAIVLGTGLLGAWLAKREGARVMRQWQESMARGEIPKEGVVSSVLVLVGGVLLITPGVLTDVTGLLLLVPWSRRAVAHLVRKRLAHRFQVQSFLVGAPGGFPGATGGRGPVIDVDAVEVDDARDASADHEASAERAEERPLPPG